jgi:hypothetical protein
MRWAVDDIAILKKHLRRAAPIHRPLIRRLIRREVLKAASTAYYHGREVDRAMAARYLLALLAANLPSLVAVSFLAALYSPRVVTRAVSRAARRLLRLPQ